MLPRVVELLSHPLPAVQTPALRAVGNVTAGSAEQTQAVVDCDALRHVLVLLSSPNKVLRKDLAEAPKKKKEKGPTEVIEVLSLPALKREIAREVIKLAS